MLSRSEVKLLSSFPGALAQKSSLSEVAERLEWSETYASRVVAGLEDRGYLQTERIGREKRISVNDIRPVEQLGDLANEYRHMDIPGLLSGSALAILYYLDRSRTASELAELSGRNRTTVYRRMEDMRNVGIVKKDHSRFKLTPEFTGLSDLARSIAHHEHRQEAMTVTQAVTFYWETLDEYLFSCGSEVTEVDYHQTGPEAFGRYGVPLLTRDRRHYLRSSRMAELTPPDLVCHGLLIDDGSRMRRYCLLLLVSQGVERASLRDRAEHYQLEADIDLVGIADGLVRYLESEGEETDEWLPAWDEFKATAAEYDLAV